MMKKLRFTLPFLLGILFMFTAFIPLHSVYGDELSGDFTVEANAAISVDADTGKIFYSQNSDTPLGIASITKIISLYLVEKEVAEGNLAWEDEVNISEYAANLSVDPDLSNVPLEQTSTYTVKDLFDSALIQSANASTVALAEKIAGSEPAFVDKMMELLKSWGITDASLVNSSGLNNEDLGENIYPGSQVDEENMLSAKDVAIVAKHLIHDYPEILEVSSTETQMFGAHTYSPVEMVNWNWMLPGQAYEKAGVDGLKTGTTDLAGGCFVGTMLQDGQRIITVILDATNQDIDLGARFVETSRLMDYTYENWQTETVLESEATIQNVKSVNVPEGKELTVPVKTADAIQLWLHSSTSVEEIEFSTTVNDVQAPADKGTVVGTIKVTNPDVLGYLEVDDTPDYTSNIITTQSVEKANIFVRIWRNVTGLFD